MTLCVISPTPQLTGNGLHEGEPKTLGQFTTLEASRKRITIPPCENSAGQKEIEVGLSKNKYEDKAPKTVCT